MFPCHESPAQHLLCQRYHFHVLQATVFALCPYHDPTIPHHSDPVHRRRQPPLAGPSCGVCGTKYFKNFNNAEERYSHMRRRHPGSRVSGCSWPGCEDHFRAEDAAEAHERWCSNGQATSRFYELRLPVVSLNESKDAMQTCFNKRSLLYLKYVLDVLSISGAGRFTGTAS